MARGLNLGMGVILVAKRPTCETRDVQRTKVIANFPSHNLRTELLIKTLPNRGGGERQCGWAEWRRTGNPAQQESRSLLNQP